MARYHQWGFIVNEAGEPIENALITVKLAGTDEIVSLYYDEFGSSNSSTTPALSAGPQLSTLANGYYEFWVGDIYEPFGYRCDQKFKLEWIRTGVAHGEIDYINIFPITTQTDPVSITNCISPSTTRNKLISDFLACKWDTHSDTEVSDGDEQFYSVHGLDFINVTEMDIIPNKVISNYLGWHWDNHRLSTVQDFSPSAGRPHNIEEVNYLDGSSTLRNKLVSNRDLYHLHSRIEDLNTIFVSSKSGLWVVDSDDWVSGIDNHWYFDITHNLSILYPLVSCWDMDTDMVIQTVSIEYLNMNTIRLDIINTDYPDTSNPSISARIASGGIQRYP